MKYLESPALSQLSSFLNSIDVGDCLVHGRVEAYTCTFGTADRPLFDSLNKQYAILSKSPEHRELSQSPFGPLSMATSRRTFISLISTLNAAFPDYDFSSVKPEQFKKESSLNIVVNYINTVMVSVIPDFLMSFSTELWSLLNAEISLQNCDIYSYIPDPDCDPFSEEGNIWCFNYFFFNKKARRLIFLTFRSVSKMADSIDSDNDPFADEWANEPFMDDMEMDLVI